jgi:hypothetical protein
MNLGAQRWQVFYIMYILSTMSTAGMFVEVLLLTQLEDAWTMLKKSAPHVHVCHIQIKLVRLRKIPLKYFHDIAPPRHLPPAYGSCHLHVPCTNILGKWRYIMNMRTSTTKPYSFVVLSHVVGYRVPGTWSKNYWADCKKFGFSSI